MENQTHRPFPHHGVPWASAWVWQRDGRKRVHEDSVDLLGEKSEHFGEELE